MYKMNINLSNCFGIESLEYEFNFEKGKLFFTKA